MLLLLLTAMLAGAMTRGRVDKINTSIEMALRIAELLTPRVRFTQQHVNIP